MVIDMRVVEEGKLLVAADPPPVWDEEEEEKCFAFEIELCAPDAGNCHFFSL